MTTTTNAVDPSAGAAQPVQTRAWLREADAARYLSVHPATLRRRRREGLVEAKKVGAAVLYSVAELERFMADAPSAGVAS